MKTSGCACCAWVPAVVLTWHVGIVDKLDLTGKQTVLPDILLTAHLQSSHDVDMLLIRHDEYYS